MPWRRSLAAIDPAELMTDVEVLDLVTAWSRVTAWSQARGLRAVAEFARRPESVPGSDPLVARARRHRPGSVARWHTEAELGAALSVSPAAAEHRLATACRSVQQFPATLRALESGRVDAAGLEAMITLRRRVPGPGGGPGRGRGAGRRRPRVRRRVRA